MRLAQHSVAMTPELLQCYEESTTVRFSLMLHVNMIHTVLASNLCDAQRYGLWKSCTYTVAADGTTMASGCGKKQPQMTKLNKMEKC